MPDQLTTEDDVTAALMRPLTPIEDDYIDTLIDQVSAKLRTALPAVDRRIAAYPAPGSIDPDTVAAVLADVIKRRFDNPKGLWSKSETTGPFAESETYPGARSGAGAEASTGLVITPADLAQLFPVPSNLPGSIKIRAALAPRRHHHHGECR